MSRKASLFNLRFKSEEDRSEYKKRVGSLSKILSRYLIFNLILCFIPIALGYFTYKYAKNKFENKDAIYTGKVEFIETEKLTTSSGLPSLSQYSLLGGLGGGADDENDVVRRVLESQEILTKTFFSPTRNGENLIINEFIKLFLTEETNLKKPFDPEKINKNTQIIELSVEEKRLFDLACYKLFDKDAKIFNYESEATKYFTIESSDHNLSLSLANELYNGLENFYDIREKGDRKKTRSIFEVNKNLALQEIRRLQNQLAKSKEKRGLRVTKEMQLKQQELSGKLIVAQEKYVQYAKQAEEIKVVNQQNEKSKFKVLSRPIYPITPEVQPFKTKLIAVTIGAVLIGLILVLFIFLLNQFYRFLKY